MVMTQKFEVHSVSKQSCFVCQLHPSKLVNQAT